MGRVTSGETGHAWVVQPGRPPVDFRFPTLPGPRRGEAAGLPPPLSRAVERRGYENAQPSPSRKTLRIRRAAVIRCTSSGPS